jgi:hypothetical protein
MTEAFFIVDLVDAEYADLRGETDLNLLTRYINSGCRKCDKSREYSTRSDALNHLFTDHFEASPEQRSVMSSQSQWVMDFGQYMAFICRKDGQRILRELKDYLVGLEKRASQIQHGVSENGQFDRDTYRIPSSLVDAFQHLLMMVVAGAHVTKAAYEHREAYIAPDPLSSFLGSSESSKIANFGIKAEISMDSATRDIVLMTYTDELSDVVTYEAVSPGLVLALVMWDIRCRDSENNPVVLLEIYRNHVRNLVCPTAQTPASEFKWLTHPPPFFSNSKPASILSGACCRTSISSAKSWKSSRRRPRNNGVF